MEIIVFGVPGNLGGASTELWHTVKLWRKHGIDVTVVPTWGDYEQDWQRRCLEIGCNVQRFVNAEAFDLDVRGKIVYGMCSKEFLRILPRLADNGGLPVWSNCMCWAFDEELKNLGAIKGFHFQSNFQAGKLLEAYGKRVNGHVIRGAFDPEEFPFAPRAREKGGTFFIGRLARPDLHKWSSNTVKIYNLVCCYPKAGLLMGVDEEVKKKLGEAPGWLNYITPQAFPTTAFFASLHCMISINGGAMENWPRIGLEAMASGVPVVTQAEWGWNEMFVHGESGFLGTQDEELAHYAAMLAHDEALRRRIIAGARLRLKVLTDPDTLWKGWESLFNSVV